MMRDVALGQYYPSNSVLHRIDPRIKILSVILYIATVFFADNPLTYLLLLVYCSAAALVAKIPIKQLAKSLKPLVFIVVFTAFFNVFWTKGETLLTPEGFFIKIYLEGIIAAVYMMVRLICLVVGTLVLISYTTTPIELTHGLESLLYPLSKIKVPVHEFAMMMSIALRFIPTLIEETDKIVNAQKARGADFETGGLIKRAKAFVPIMIPLFVSAFRRADELATAMECRCYNGSPNRTRMNVLRIRGRDVAYFVTVIVLCALLILCTSKLGLIDYGFLPEALR